MNAPYKAQQYSGKEWGLFHVPTRNWMVFGTQSAIRKRAAQLNAEPTVRNNKGQTA